MNQSCFVFYPFVSGFGGIERLIVDLAQFVQKQGQTLTLLTFRNAVDFSKYGGENITVEQVNCKRSFRSEVSALRRFVDERGIAGDRVLVMEMRGVMYAGRALSAGYSVHIADPPSLLPKDLSKWSFSLARFYPSQQSSPGIRIRIRGQIIHWLARRGVKRANRAVTMTNRNVDELFTAYGRTFDRVSPGVSIPKTVNRKPRTNGETSFLSVCRLEPSKRIDSIIECFADARAKPDSPVNEFSTLQIVGHGSEEQRLKELVRDRRIESAVKFHGFISDDELESVYSKSDIFVMPAKQGYGLPGLESLARGLHLIVHQESGVAELLDGTEQVQIIDDSGAALVAAMMTSATAISHAPSAPPHVPTSTEWASQIVEICGW